MSDNVGNFSSSVTGIPAESASATNGAIGIKATSDTGDCIRGDSINGTGIVGESVNGTGIYAQTHSSTQPALVAKYIGSEGGTGVLGHSANGRDVWGLIYRTFARSQ